MNKVIIIGAGGHGAEIDEYILFNQHCSALNSLEVIGFLDDNPDNYARYKFSAPLLGGVNGHTIIPGCSYLMGIANLSYRRLFVDRFLELGATFVSLIHATAYISPSARIGEGVVIGPYANLGPNVSVGDFTLINSRCSLGHDTVVGKFNFISPNVCFSGGSRVGDGNLFGINSATIPGIVVGNGNKIAAGMVLDKDIANDSVVFYRYKERVIAVLK
ncbi:MAG: acetyltransferase [Geobacteraceae bacterium]|nr:acetyltransferase [Geobacteraceae bacterium]